MLINKLNYKKENKMKKSIYYKQLLKLIESLKEKEIYPKDYDIDDLKYVLVNLYVSWWLINNKNVNKKDKELLATIILPDLVTHTIQSVFHDSIEHFDQEILLFCYFANHLDSDVIRLSEIYENLEYYYEELTKNNLLNSEENKIISKILQEIKKRIDHVEDVTSFNIIESLYPYIEEIFKISVNFNDLPYMKEDNLEEPISKWINKMKQIPTNLWKQLANYYGPFFYKSLHDFLEEKLFDLETFSEENENLEEFLSDYSELVEMTDEQFRMERSSCSYLDMVYYKGFYNGLLPLYNKFKTYLLHPTIKTFNEVMQQIDYVKDLQHHTNFFWHTLRRPIINFISYSKIDELIQYVTDSDIKKIYKKYYILINRY